MASKLAEKAPGWVTRLLLPEIQEMKGDLKALNAKVNSTNERIDSLRNEMKSEISRLDGKIDALGERFETRINVLSEKVDVVREIERMKIEIQELKQRRTLN